MIKKERYLRDNDSVSTSQIFKIQDNIVEQELLEKKRRSEELQMKNIQKQRYRADIYAVNAVLKKAEQERFMAFIASKEGIPLSESDDDDDSCNSNIDSDTEPGETSTKKSSSKKSSVAPLDAIKRSKQSTDAVGASNSKVSSKVSQRLRKALDSSVSIETGNVSDLIEQCI